MLFFSQNKASRGEKIIFKKGKENIANDAELCKVFNKYFSNIVASLNILNVNNFITAKENAKKYPQQINCTKTYPSITTINKQCLSSNLNTPVKYSKKLSKCRYSY